MNHITSGFYKIGIKQAAMCRNSPETYLQLLVTAGSMRSLVHTIYCSLVAGGLLKRIEDLPISEQWEWKGEAERLAAGRLAPNKVKFLGKTIYCITSLMENY